MIKSKVIEILQSFSKDDLKKFSDFLCSPVFNKREVIVNLFNVYKKFHPDFGDKNLTKEKVYSKIFPGKKYNDEVFRNQNSILLKLTEDFLSYQNYSNDPLNIKKHLLSEINHRNLLSGFEKNYEESRKILENNTEKDQGYFYDSYNIFLQKDIYNSYLNKFSKVDIQNAEKNLVIFFLMKVMEIQNYILYECRILDLDKSLYLDDKFLDEIFKKIPKEITQLPQIQIYFNALKLEQTKKDIYYKKLRDLLIEHGHLIEKEKHYNKYIDMIDYIKRTKSQEDKSTVTELFQLRKEIIEKGLFTENFITNMFFLNLVKSGIKLKEYEWVENFIKSHGHLIIEKYRDSTKELSYAYLYFEKKEFDISLSHTAKVRYEDNYYNLEIRNLIARIYYETDHFELLNEFLNSYRMYLSKNRSLNKKDFESHNLFINFINKIQRIKELKKYHKLDAVFDLLEKKEFINKIWIQNKIKELEETE
ncbi:MAG: hypothetical protein LH629_01380 [Ignavibacteria bacterium]|nr:hypothetical protein [Ignavibacteria bacterium]